MFVLTVIFVVLLIAHYYLPLINITIVANIISFIWLIRKFIKRINVEYNTNRSDYKVLDKRL